MNPYRWKARRAGTLGPSFDRAASYRAVRVRLAIAGVLLAAGAIAVVLLARGHRSPRPQIPPPPELLTSSASFPPAPASLRPSVPLAPLLAADAPDRLALMEPGETAINLRPGEPFRVRFNRPMVEGARVGKPAAEAVLVFSPKVRGRASWTSRSSYAFEPAASTWDATRTAQVTVAGDVHALSGEALEEVPPRTVVFDAGPRFVRADRADRLVPGEPLRLLFSGKIDARALPSELLLYEVDGGRRMIPFSIAERPLDKKGLTPVELSLKEALEPGAHLAVAVAPPIANGGSRPRVVNLEMAPRPRIEGIACTAEAKEASQCEHTEPPGTVVDVEEALILLSSEELGALPKGAVETKPALDALAVKVEEKKRLVIRGDWVPGQVYEVRVGKLVDKDGHTLARTAPLAVRSAGRTPEVRLGKGKLAFEHDAKTALPIQGIHVDEGEIRVGPVPPGREIEALLSPSRWLDELPAERRSSLPILDLLPTARPNRWGKGTFDWRARAGAEMAVFAPVPARRTPKPGEKRAVPEATFAQRTDLGIDAMLLTEGAMVWVTSIATAQPVAGAEVTVAPRPADPPPDTPDDPAAVDGTTDEHGVAWIPLASAAFLERGAAVRARRGDDRAVLLVDPRSSLGPRHLGVRHGAAPPPPDAWRASVFTDRGICRPGETVHAKATLRTTLEGAYVAPQGGEAHLVLLGHKGEAPLADKTVALSRFGTADADFPIEGSPGTYRIEVRVTGQDQAAGSTSFEVGEYREPTMRVDLSASATRLDDGDPLRVGIVARHLFGTPAAGLPARWTLIREPGGDYPSAWEDYTFTPADASSRTGTVASGDVTLDAKGSASIEAKIALGAPQRETALVSVTVRDLSGVTTTARRRVHTYPATFEVGLRQPPKWIASGAPIDVAAVVIDHDGAAQPGRKVEARILREGWNTYWERSARARGEDDDAEGEDEPRPQPRNARRADVAHRCRITSAKEPAGCSWTPDRPGTYLVEVTTRDDKHRTSTASQRVYVAGPDEHPSRDPAGAPITLTLEKTTLDVGETAEVAFESPFPDAAALLVVEREGVLHREVRRVSAGGNVFRVPVTAAMIPNAFVSLSLVRPRTGAPGRTLDLDGPDLRVGLTEITVHPKAPPLTVTIDAPGESAPAGSEVPIGVTVVDDEGKPASAEVALYAVDEGTLRVTAYTTPDATDGLFSRRPAAFAWEDLRRMLVSRVDAPLPPGAGGDGDSTGARARPRDEQERFDPTPLWLGRLATDAQGKASSVLLLPARPAQYRIMAVAVDAGVSEGHAERPITASMPIVVRTVLPTFVTAGDHFEAVAFVHNTEDQPAEVTVTPSLDGAARDEIRIHLDPKGEARVTAPAVAGETGEVRVRFGARSDRAVTVVEKRVPIAARGRLVRSEAAYAVEGARDVTVALPEPVAGRGALTLSVARHPFVGFDLSLESLLSSPDEGTEPTASSLIALAAYSALDTGKRPGSVSPAELGARVTSTVRRLVDLQTPSGGFGFFSHSSPTDTYLSAYALHALLAARRAGFTVPAANVDRAVAYLGELVRNDVIGVDHKHDDLAFALRVLAEGGARDDERNKTLFTQYEALSPFGQAELALALDGGDRRRDTLAIEATQRALTTTPDEEEHRWYDGSARTLGAALEAALAVDAAAPFAAPLAGKILALRGGPEAAWWSRHEESHALAALAAYAATLADADPVAPRVTLDGAPVTPAEQGRALVWYTLPESAGKGSHTLRVEVDGTAYFAISARWTVPLGPDDETARGETAALHRVLEDATGKPLGPDAHVRLGDLVRVRLFLFSEHEAPPFLAIRDRLTGGLEPVDADHDTSPRESLWALLGMGPDDDAVDARGHHAEHTLDLISHRAFLPTSALFYLQRSTTGLHEVTYGARATTPGTFVLPPAEVEALYAPRFVARSASTTITVDP